MAKLPRYISLHLPTSPQISLDLPRQGGLLGRRDVAQVHVLAAALHVRLRHGDGLDGWASEAPFDLILGAAAPERLPNQLLEQLAPRGRLILPVGGERQQLMMVTATPEGYVEEMIEEVNFVPMVRGVSR